MPAITRALIASAFAVTSFTAQAETFTVDFFGNGLSDTYDVDHFDNSLVDFTSNMGARNIVEPELTFTGLTFMGVDNYFSMSMTEPIESVTLNFVRITSLEFSSGLAETGYVYGMGTKGVAEAQLLDGEFAGDAVSMTFTTNDNFPFQNLSWEFRSPQYTFVDPETGETISTGYALYGLDSVSFNTVTAPIPEPETYAMMLAGLGAIGFVSRRKKAQLVKAYFRAGRAGRAGLRWNQSHSWA